eukprot:CAMPEP_0204339176 /NCGR_PEP_ID=MMETSP0469-20131031/21605_1 /ASSEMBLY_ACC=CAM_ASM_000384 /TAXON_ID=2969 /ORGANISM="Oxyrrhis marina" /LENGTH=228 /DNA_ID=CAMNT_0051323485 /DNA_START=26 /DNA_END=712 /DNA_ORIENTATION=+
MAVQRFMVSRRTFLEWEQEGEHGPRSSSEPPCGALRTSQEEMTVMIPFSSLRCDLEACLQLNAVTKQQEAVCGGFTEEASGLVSNALAGTQKTTFSRRGSSASVSTMSSANQHESTFTQSPDTTAESRTSVTTIAIRNIDHGLTIPGICDKLDEAGYAGTYDYVYTAFGKRKNVNCGVAYVNFVSAEVARAVWKSGRKTIDLGRSGSIARFGPARVQGKEAHIAMEQK